MEKYLFSFNFKTKIKKITVALLLFFVFTNKVYSQSSANYYVSSGTGFSLTTGYGGTAINMTTDTTSLIGAGADATASVVTNIGFDFFLMSNRFTQFSVNDDGIVQLGGTAVPTNQYSINGGTTASPRIAAFNANLRTGSTTGKVHYKVVGAAPNRILVVEFYNMQLFYTAAAAAGISVWQVRLYETSGLVEFVYGAMDVSSVAVIAARRSPSVGFYTGNTTGSFISYFYATNTYSTTAAYAANPAVPAIGNITDLHSIGKLVRFSPKGHLTNTITPTIASPTLLNFTGITATGTTLNWTASSPNTGIIKYAIYRSTDNIIFNYVASVNLGTNTYAATGLASGTLHYWKVYPLSEGTLGAAVTGQATTLSASYCSPTSEDSDGLYINSVAFVGALVDPPANTSTFSATGFQNFTTLTTKAQQVQGEGINIITRSAGAVHLRGTWKAWIDWNRNGIFEPATEEVYNIQGFAGSDTTFGFVIPITALPGDYRIRIRVNNGTTFLGAETFGFDFTPCDDFNLGFLSTSNYGETEDYLFTVIEKCSSLITSKTDGSRCGAGSVSLNATATAGVTEFRWYTTATGGSYVSSPVTGTSTTFTPSISATTNYYVTAYNGSCESQVRTLVVAKVNPTPVVTFTPTTTTVCGEADILQLTASGDKETTHLINENFESGALGVFSNINNDSNGAAVDAITSWKNQTSTFVPTNTNIWFPAISSGFGTNKFAVAYSDSDPVPTNTIENSMALTNAVSTNTFLNLTLKLKLFYSRYFPDGYVDSTADEFVRIELSTDGGTTYPVLLQEFTSDVGIGNKFTEFSYNLSAYLNQSNLKIRIRHRSYAGTGWLPDGIAVDDIELFGERPLNTSFSYDTTAVAAYTNIACTPPYAYVPGTPVATIYIKPTPVQLETASTFTVPVSATLSSGCSATGSVVVTNNTKTWNPATSVTDWATANWKQDTNPPTADKCVIIKKPVVLGASTNGFAKNIKIETASGNTGNLNIAGSLTVTDAINTTAATDLVVESDGNLKQVNESLVNTTPVSVRRLHSLTGLRKEYNYLSSPVSYQNMKAIFGNNPANVPFVTKLNEPTNFFVNAAATDWDGPEDRAKGFAVREPIIGYTGIPAQNLEFNEAQYQGIPNNGNAISLSLDYTPNRGYNLAGNPYPSNLDIVELYANSTTTLIDPTFRFWDNTVNEIYTQMGGAYQGYSYALYNVLTDPAIGYGTNAPGDGSGESSKIPNRVIKVSQAFMVRATGPNAKLNFNNTQRKTTNTNSVFFGKTSPHNRYHLELVKSNGFTVQNGIAYFNGGNQAFGLEDTRVPNSQASDALFSFAGDAKVVINGRSAFTVDDMMPLGLRHFTSGTYKIQVVDEEGVFANGQSIYLKDKQLNILTDLTAGDYTFTSEAGEFTNRFEIVYKPEMVLGTDGIGKSKIEVYRDVQDFVVRSADKTIENIELYDAAGRLVFKKNGKSNEIRFDANRLAEGMYILKVQLKDGEQFTKKIRK